MNKAREAPRVSVVLATYNRARMLCHSAGSVLKQSFRDLELIVVDDGSTDDVAAAVDALDDPRVVLIRRERNGGVAAARNTGIRSARGTFLAFQDSDDEWLLNKLERQIQTVGNGAGMALCGLLRVGERRIRRYTPPADRPGGPVSFRNVIGHPRTYTQTWLVRTELVKAAGGFDERLRTWEDWELLIRLSRQTRIQSFAEPLVVSTRQADSLTIDKSGFIDSLSVILEKHADALAECPDLHARLYYLHGRLLAVDGRMSNARAQLRRAIRMRPFALRPWLLAAASLLGANFVQRRLAARQIAPGS